jgi:hypothetical protein
MIRSGRSVKMVQPLLAGLGVMFTLSAFVPMAGCISNIGQCQRQNPSINECAGRSKQACDGIPGCTSLAACVHHCVGLAPTDCAASSDCFWYADTSECLASHDVCSLRPLDTCTQEAACKVGTDCQGDVDCGSTSDEKECQATAGCYYQQGVT